MHTIPDSQGQVSSNKKISLRFLLLQGGYSHDRIQMQLLALRHEDFTRPACMYLHSLENCRQLTSFQRIRRGVHCKADFCKVHHHLHL